MKNAKVEIKAQNWAIIRTESARYLQSYSSIIAKWEKGKITLDREKWDYSKTTGKHRNEFLQETKAETMKKIQAGIYELADLNG